MESAEKELGNDAIVVSSDARSLTEIDALASRVKSEFDTFDLLFVNAGFSIRAPIESPRVLPCSISAFGPSIWLARCSRPCRSEFGLPYSTVRPRAVAICWRSIRLDGMRMKWYLALPRRSWWASY